MNKPPDLPQPARADLLAPGGGACNTRNTRETVAAGASFVVFLLYIACSQDKGRISHAMERHNASRALDMGAGSETRRDGGGTAATRHAVQVA